MPLTNKEEFQAWVQLPQTREFLSILRSAQVRMMEAWGSGQIWSEAQQAQAVLLGGLARLRFSEADQDDGPKVATIEDLANLNLSEEITDGQENPQQR